MSSKLLFIKVPIRFKSFYFSWNQITDDHELIGKLGEKNFKELCKFADGFSKNVEILGTFTTMKINLDCKGSEMKEIYQYSETIELSEIDQILVIRQNLLD